MCCKNCILNDNKHNDTMDIVCPLCNCETISLSLDDLRLLAKSTNLKSVKNVYHYFKRLIEKTRVRINSELLCVK